MPTPTPLGGVGVGKAAFQMTPRGVQVLPGGGTQSFPEFERFTPHAQHEGGRRWPAPQIGEYLQHGVRRDGVGADLPVRAGRDFVEPKRPRRAGAGIDEKRQIGVVQIEGVFDLELEVAHKTHVGQGAGFEFGQQLRPDGVVAP